MERTNLSYTHTATTMALEIGLVSKSRTEQYSATDLAKTMPNLADLLLTERWVGGYDVAHNMPYN